MSRDLWDTWSDTLKFWDAIRGDVTDTIDESVHSLGDQREVFREVPGIPTIVALAVIAIVEC